MKKLLVGLVIAGLTLLGVGTTAFADVTLTEEDMASIPSVGVQIPDEISLDMTREDIRVAMESQPINFADYFDFGVDFLSKLFSRLARTANPAYITGGKLSAKVSLFEQDGFDVIWGISQDNGQFWGIEIKKLPLSGALQAIFTKLHPLIVYCSENGGSFSFGATYEFREE